MTHDIDTALLHAPILGAETASDNNIAFIAGNESIEYGQLRQEVLRGSAWLHNTGCMPGDRVAICLPKSIETVKIIFSSLAAGAIFVPIDPMTPPARVAYILSNADVNRLITHQRMAATLGQLEQPISTRITVIDNINSFLDLTSSFSSDYEPPQRHAHDTALLYYTSGTTGVPKAIMLSHENVTSFTQWAISEFSISKTDRVASHAPFHFDLSTLDLFAATRVGASVVLLDEASIKFPAKISQLIESGQINIWYSVPTALVQLLRYGALERRKLSDLRLVLFAGEVFPVPDLVKLIKKLPQCEFVNLYGPTETNVCTYHRITTPPEPESKDIPIGVPCEHLQVRLYQEDGTEAAHGDTGEIAVYGPAVMQGYWNHPELTANSRIGGDPGSYRTGDFAYLDDNDQLHLIGRKDDQIKIRGHRVELMEVTSVLCLYPAVMEAVALLSKPADVEATITAFMVPEPDQSLNIESVQEHCKKWLPAYAIPRHMVVLDSIPRTATGKIDRQKLIQHPDFS